MTRRFIALAAIAVASLAAGAVPAQRRLYTIRCVEENGASQRTLYEAEVEGPPATDFRVVMRDARHDIEAAFINEPAGGGATDARVHLRSRRAYGTSRNGLPLWEEDEQQTKLRVAPGQEIEMLPFGAAGGGGLLRLIVAPRDAAGDPSQPLQIRIGPQALGGAISVDAVRAPHWFRADVAIGNAHGVGRLFLEESGTIAMSDGTTIDLTPHAVPYGDRWQFAGVSIDAPFARGWRGVELLGKPLTFPLPNGQTLSITLTPEATQ